MLECITQTLDCSNGVPDRHQQHLQDGIADSHNCCNHALECVLVLVCKIHHVVNDLGYPSGKFLNYLGDQVKDRLQCSHSSLECLRCTLVLFDFTCQLRKNGDEHTNDGNGRRSGQSLKASL